MFSVVRRVTRLYSGTAKYDGDQNELGTKVIFRLAIRDYAA